MLVERFDKILPDLETEAAVACAARAAQRFGLTAGTFRASVVGVETAQESYERVLHRIERRLVELKTLPGGSGPPQHVPNPDRIDPWAVDPARIENDSRVVSTCNVCSGTKRMACGNCRGSGRARCGYCGGSGRVTAQRKGQWTKSCPSCRGRGDQKCVCSGGSVLCQPCSATGKITAWLVVNRSVVEQVAVHPKNAAASVHRSVSAPDDFNANIWPNRLLDDTWLQASGVSVQAPLSARLDAKADRLLDSRLQRFSSAVYTVRYATKLAKGTIEVAGQPPDITATTDWSPLRSRLTIAACAGVATLAGFGYVLYRYQAKHEWYARYGNTTGIMALGALAAVGMVVTISGLLMPARARSLFDTWLPLSATLAFLFGIGTAYNFQRPTATGAKTALAAQDLTRAELEAHALVDLKLDSAAGHKVLDDLHMNRLRGMSDIAAQCNSARDEWNFAQAKAEAGRIVSASIEEAGTRSFGAHDAAQLEQLARNMDGLDSALRDKLTWLAAALRANSCLDSDDTACTKKNFSQMLGMSTPAMAGNSYDTKRIAESAKDLRPILDAIDAENLRARKEALIKALGHAQNYSAAMGEHFERKTHPLQKRLDLVERKLSRAKAHAQAKLTEGTPQEERLNGANAATQNPLD